MNSDLPGEIKALVREIVYDMGTGNALIPQGTRLVAVAYGENSIQVVTGTEPCVHDVSATTPFR